MYHVNDDISRPPQPYAAFELIIAYGLLSISQGECKNCTLLQTTYCVNILQTCRIAFTLHVCELTLMLEVEGMVATKTVGAGISTFGSIERIWYFRGHFHQSTKQSNPKKMNLWCPLKE